jgi:hypothetical protein
MVNGRIRRCEAKSTGKAMFVYSVNGERVAEIVARGAPLTDRGVSELIDEVRGSNAQWVVIPAERLGKDFFRMATTAGDFVERFVKHKLRLAILGDVKAPSGLSDKCVFLRDCNELPSRMAPAK